MFVCSKGRVAQQSKKFNKKANNNNNKNKAPSVVSSTAGLPGINTPQQQNLKNNRAAAEKTRNMSDVSTSMISAGIAGKSSSNSEAARMSARTRNLALMLIPVNLLFLAFLAPVVITMYTYKQLGDDKLTLAIVEFLSYCNFTINFFIYFLTSSKFREEFFKFVDEVCKHKSCGGGGGGSGSGSSLAPMRNGGDNKSAATRGKRV